MKLPLILILLLCNAAFISAGGLGELFEAAEAESILEDSNGAEAEDAVKEEDEASEDLAKLGHFVDDTREPTFKWTPDEEAAMKAFGEIGYDNDNYQGIGEDLNSNLPQWFLKKEVLSKEEFDKSFIAHGYATKITDGEFYTKRAIATASNSSITQKLSALPTDGVNYDDDCNRFYNCRNADFVKLNASSDAQSYCCQAFAFGKCNDDVKGGNLLQFFQKINEETCEGAQVNDCPKEEKKENPCKEIKKSGLPKKIQVPKGSELPKKIQVPKGNELPKKTNGMPVWSIVLIAVGGVALVVIVVGLVFRRRRSSYKSVA